MSVVPQVLSPYGSGNTWSQYVWHMTGTGAESHLEIYKNNSDLAHSLDTSYWIAVNTNTDTWIDYGSGLPNSVSEITETNGDITILLHNPQSQLFKFLKPTSASWLPLSSGGGGTVAQGFSYSGQLIFAPSVPSLSYTIPQSSSAGAYTIYSYDGGNSSLEETINHSTASSVGTIGGVSNFDSSNTHKLLSPLGDVLDTYTPGGVKKVHCNFW